MTCTGCASGTELDVDISMAFQPIYDSVADSVWGYEALVRGVDGEGAGSILAQVQPEQRYRFDQDCRTKAIELASRLFPPAESLKLSINFMPNAVYEPAACLRATLRAADQYGFPLTSRSSCGDVVHPAQLTMPASRSRRRRRTPRLRCGRERPASSSRDWCAR